MDSSDFVSREKKIEVQFLMQPAKKKSCIKTFGIIFPMNGWGAEVEPLIHSLTRRLWVHFLSCIFGKDTKPTLLLLVEVGAFVRL